MFKFLNRINAGIQEQRLLLEQKKKISPSLKSRVDQYFDPVSTQRKRDSLMQEAFGKSYWKDTKQIYLSEKIWEAPKKLLNRQMFDLSSKNLHGKDVSLLEHCSKHKLTLVAMFFNLYGEKHCMEWLAHFPKKDTSVLLVNTPNKVNVNENMFKSPVLWAFIPWIRYNVHKNLHHCYLLHFGNIAVKRSLVGMENGLVGWINLVDQKGRIRWQAHGKPTAAEIDILLELSSNLTKSVAQ
jgi:hypothetical protein